MANIPTSILTRVRRNHAFEHATLNILSKKTRTRLVGYSDFNGFWIVGNIDLDELQLALEEALTRMKNGERKLAITENCGTNYVASGMLVGITAWFGMLGTGSGFRKKLERLPIVVALTTIVLVFSKPFGPLLQERVTTDPNLDGVLISGVDVHYTRGLTVHRVHTIQM